MKKRFIPFPIYQTNYSPISRVSIFHFPSANPLLWKQNFSVPRHLPAHTGWRLESKLPLSDISALQLRHHFHLVRSLPSSFATVRSSQIPVWCLSCRLVTLILTLTWTLNLTLILASILVSALRNVIGWQGLEWRSESSLCLNRTEIMVMVRPNAT